MNTGHLFITAIAALGIGGFMAVLGVVLCRSWSLQVRSMGGKHELRPPALGIAVFGGFLLPLIYHVGFALTTRGDQYYPIGTQRMLVAVLYFTSLALLVWGWRCDRGRGGLETILFQWSAQAAMWWAGLRIERLAFDLPGMSGFDILLPAWASLLVTLLLLTLISSVVELLDGVDGMAALVVAFAALAVFFHASATGAEADLLVRLFAWLLASVALLAAWLGRSKGKMLLGKNGAFLMGYWLATLLVLARQKETTAKILTPFLFIALLIAVVLFGFIERSLGFHWRDRLRLKRQKR